MLPDLNRLNVFYQVYTHLSITEAADKLHISPSAVSQQLKKLEGELQITLFTSLHKRLVPTSNGKRLFSIVEPLIQSLNDNIQALENRRIKPSGIL